MSFWYLTWRLIVVYAKWPFRRWMYRRLLVRIAALEIALEMRPKPVKQEWLDDAPELLEMRPGAVWHVAGTRDIQVLPLPNDPQYPVMPTRPNYAPVLMASSWSSVDAIKYKRQIEKATLYGGVAL